MRAFLVMVLACLTLIPATSGAGSAALPSVSSPADMITLALSMPTTRHEATLSGENAVKIKKMTNSIGGDIIISSRVVKRYEQPGCGRVEFVILIPNVMTNEGKVLPLWRQNMELDICRDGKPPLNKNVTD